MSTWQVLGLGLLAGGTIFLGLPVARLRRLTPATRVLLNGGAIGVLLFLFWDVLAQAWAEVDRALAELADGTGSLGPVLGYGLLFAGGLSVGLLSLVGYERWMAARLATADRARRGFGPGAMAAAELPTVRRAAWSPARRLSMLIAIGIGVHNLAEGLAIGQAAASGAVSLAAVLVVGFGLHNATEGFGIAAPLAGERPSWGFLAVLGLVGGGPTFVGTALGGAFPASWFSVLAMTLAAGSILYVVVQLLGVVSRLGHRELLAVGLLVGLLAGFGTDAIVTYAGL